MIKYKGCPYCKHYRFDGTCSAFYPDNIPIDIASGATKHITPLPGQKNSIVYEPADKPLLERIEERLAVMSNAVKKRVEVVEGDITQQEVDAIVNAANESLIAGGGVSGAIHRLAGRGLEEECLKLGWCNEGEAKITKGYNLPAKWIIHTVGPVWEGGVYEEDKILAQCYRNCFAFVEPYNIKTIAFPAISAGTYGFPIDKAARVALKETRMFLEKNKTLEKVIFVCFEKKAYDCYANALDEITSLVQK